MANLETQQIDHVISKRRAMILGGGAALVALAMPNSAGATVAVNSFTDNDILNFALNLEYLEANFYYLAAFGTNISTANSSSMLAGAPVLGITGSGTQGSVTVKSNPKVPFAMPSIKSFAIETAIEEGRHVNFLRTALGNSTAVAQPSIDLLNSFNVLAGKAGLWQLVRSFRK